MRNISYRGYGRRTSNQPIQLPDESQKILSEGQRILRGMDRAQESKEKHERDQISARKEKGQIESADVVKATNNANEFTRAIRDAELHNLKTEYNDIKVREKEWEMKQQKKDDLLKLAPKLFSAYVEMEKGRNVELQAAGQRILIDSGLTPEEQKMYLFGDRSSQNVEQGVNKMLAKLKGNLDPDQLKSLKNLSGRKLLGAQKYYAQNAGRSLYSEQLREWSQSYEHDFGNGKKLSLFDITERGLGDESDMNQLREIFDTQFYKQFGGTSNLILTEEMKPWIEEKWGVSTRGLSTKLRKDSVGEYKEADRKELISTIHEQGIANPGNAFVRYINEKSGGLGELRGKVRGEAFGMIATAVTKGEITPETWQDIKNHYFTLDGQKTPSRLGALYKDEVAQVDAAILKAEKKWVEDRKSEEKIFDYKQKENVLNFRMTEGRPMNDNEIVELEKRYEEFGYETPTWLKDYRSQEELEVSDSKAVLDDLVKKDALTMAELVGSRRYNADLVDAYIKKTIDGPESVSQGTRTGSKSAVKNAVDSLLGDIKTTEVRTDQSLIMGGMAEDILVDRVHDSLAANVYPNARQAWVQEANALAKEIKAEEGIWKLVKNENGTNVIGEDGGFEYLQKGLSLDEKSIRYREKVDNDKNYIDKAGSFNKIDIREIQGVSAGKDIPSFIGTIAAKMSEDPYEVMNRILRANGEKEIEPAGMARTTRFVSPTFKRLVLKKPSTAKTVEAVIKTTEQTNPGTDSDEPVLNLLKEKKAVNNGEHNYVLDKSGRTNTVDISTYSTGDVYNTFRVGNGIEFGVYAATGNELRNAIDKGVIAPTDPFDAFTQETILMEKLEGLGMLKVDDDYTIPGVGQAWVVPEVSTNEALRTVFGDLTAGLAKNVVKEEGIEAIATVADTGNKLRKAVINKIKDPATKAFFKRLGNTVVQETKEILAEEKTNLGTELAESTKEDVKDLASLFMQAMAEVDEQMKNYTINKRTRRLYPIDKNSIFSQRGIDPYKLKPELLGEFHGG